MKFSYILKRLQYIKYALINFFQKIRQFKLGKCRKSMLNKS